MTGWPCQRNPERWFSDDRTELGRAVHECLSHCLRLVECDATEPRSEGGVLAGVRYVTDKYGRVRAERRVLREVTCDGCAPDVKPTADTGACGEAKGYHRHLARRQEPCEPCRLAYAGYQRDRRRLLRAAA